VKVGSSHVTPAGGAGGFDKAGYNGGFEVHARSYFFRPRLFLCEVINRGPNSPGMLKAIDPRFGAFWLGSLLSNIGSGCSP